MLKNWTLFLFNQSKSNFFKFLTYFQEVLFWAVALCSFIVSFKLALRTNINLCCKQTQILRELSRFLLKVPQFPESVHHYFLTLIKNSLSGVRLSSLRSTIISEKEHWAYLSSGGRTALVCLWFLFYLLGNPSGITDKQYRWTQQHFHGAV